VLGPLREQFESYRIAPFTVLADPDRTASLLSDDADSDMAFLFRNQLKEADLVCMSKADLYPDLAGIPGIAARCVSAKSGEGVAEWLDEVLFGSLEAGHTTLEIDYARYARAEAALAWLNLSLTFEPDQYASPALVVGPFLDRMDAALTAAGIAIVHLKIFDRSPAGWLKAAACANGEEPHVEGNLDASPTGRHELLVNLRAVADAGRVRAVVEEQVRQLPGAVLNARLDCFSPSPPRPERRVPKKNA
jgi:hypothetical protein